MRYLIFTHGDVCNSKAQPKAYWINSSGNLTREVFVLQIQDWFDQIVAGDQASTRKINHGFLDFHARSFQDLDKACERAMEQIKSRRYDQELREDGRNDILAYGIGFYKKSCKVVVEKL